ncbi:MAG: 3-hydroxyacyl-CoA dehydrogenase NAD-binding domain-containing protein [Gemmatimonadaceae bacterium]|nr:3-hydroxyacyl-CoA dehydrogenase NAD-binding domain-containing protein [Gemmatimonadaceae bacterium]
MPLAIRRAAVLGAGTMGSGIAAQLANAGLPVLLLDLVPAGATERSILAAQALERMRTRQQPAPFMSADAAALVTPGNIEDDLAALAEVDWIVEAVIEDPAAKGALLRAVDAVRRPGSIVTSNTSTIPLARLLDGQSDALAADFAITHFFNPPRHMRLVELVTGPRTRPEVAAALREVCDVRLGKSVVGCKDTPGFIANRIGTYFMVAAMHEAVRHGLTVEEVDAICGKPMGLPKTGVFALTDLVGLDLMPHILRSFHATLPPDDAFRALPAAFAPMDALIAAGRTGRKGGGGFYRLRTADDGTKTKEVVDLATGAYRAERPARLASLEAARGAQAVRRLVEAPDAGGRFAQALLTQALGYAAALVPAIADRVSDVDEAMRLGYGWTFGPFELIDRLGPGTLAAWLRAAGRPVPPLLATADPFYRVDGGVLQERLPSGDYAAVPRAPGVLRLADVKRASTPVFRTGSAAVWDIGDGVLCLEFTGKMNALDGEVMTAIRRVIEHVGDGRGTHRALVIHNEGEHFSVGANLGLALFSLNVAMYDAVEQSVADGQRTLAALQAAPFPVVAAPAGRALGGGCEVVLHADAVQAHAETYIGLVEAGVGLIPGWGGCKELLLRHVGGAADAGQGIAALGRLLEMIGTARTSTSAADARRLGFLRSGDGITMNRDRLLADAKARALALVDGYVPPAPRTVTLPGPAGKAMMLAAVDAMVAAGTATPHDRVVAEALATVLSGGAGGTLDADALLDLERTAFMSLVRTPGTLARIEHLLATGTPLRN